MKRFNPTKAAQASEANRITGSRSPRWVVLVLCLWSFYSNRNGRGVRKSRSRKAVGGVVPITQAETHRTARRMVRAYARELRVVSRKEVA